MSLRVEALDLPGLDPAWSRRVRVRGAGGAEHTWHVLDNGSSGVAGTLLCVHGNPTWSYLWRRLVAAAPPGWRVIAPDQLGMGFSDRPSGTRTLADRVRDLGDLTAALGVTGPVVTVGHDWGGSISLGWALAHRSQLRGVVLTNTAVAQPPGDRGPALIRLAHSPVLREAVCVRTPAFVRATTAISRPPLSRSVRAAFAAPYAAAERRRSVGAFVADIPFSPGHPSRPALEAIAEGVRSLDVPALLLWGPRDPVFSERYLTDLRARLPQAALHRFEGAGHLVTEDAPAYADAVVRWLADLPGPASPPPPPAPIGFRRPWAALAERASDTSPAVAEVRRDGTARVTDWATLSRQVDQLAAGLVTAGVRPGDRVALLVEPSVELTTAVYAIWRAGAVIVVADKGLGLRGMRRALRGAHVDHVLGTPSGLAAARAMGLPGGRIVTRAGPAVRRALGATWDLDTLIRRGAAASLPDEPQADQLCAVVFTSGATGPAKGVCYRHGQLAAQLALVRHTYAITSADRLVAAFAPFALLGPGLGVASAVPAVDVTTPGALTAGTLADAVAAVQATLVFASPAALRNVVATAEGLDERQRNALRGVRLLMSAGAPVPTGLLGAVADLIGSSSCHTPYGMTEALPVTDVSLVEILAAGEGVGVCVGRPLPGVQVRLDPVTADGTVTGRLTDAAGVTGEICVRAAHVKDSYDGLWATDRVSSRHAGWHATGDVGHLDAEGRLWVEGRLTHLVTTAEGVVTPVPVEQRVERLADVQAAAAVGVGPRGTQATVVVVERGEPSGRGLRLAPDGLREQVRRAAGTEVAAVLVTDRLPVDIRHASKVDRTDVARRAARLLSGR